MSEQLLHADAGRPSRQLYQAGGTSDRYTAADSRFAGAYDSSRSALQVVKELSGQNHKIKKLYSSNRYLRHVYVVLLYVFKTY